MTALDALAWALGVGSSAAGITVVVRALPWTQRQMLERNKPWACDVCMGFWTTVLVALGLALWKHDASLIVAGCPGYPWTLWVLRKTGEPTGPPPMPPLEDS